MSNIPCVSKRFNIEAVKFVINDCCKWLLFCILNATCTTTIFYLVIRELLSVVKLYENHNCSFFRRKKETNMTRYGCYYTQISTHVLGNNFWTSRLNKMVRETFSSWDISLGKYFFIWKLICCQMIAFTHLTAPVCF